MACMDDIPEFVIQYEIMSYLTYEEKIWLNQSLKPIHRVSKKIPLKDLVKHEYHLIVHKFLSYIKKHKQETSNKILPKKGKAIKDIFLYCLRTEVLKLIASAPAFKQIILHKCEEFTNKDNVEQYRNYSLKDKKAIIYLTTLAQKKIKEFKFDGYNKFILNEDGNIKTEPYLK